MATRVGGIDVILPKVVVATGRVSHRLYEEGVVFWNQNKSTEHNKEAKNEERIMWAIQAIYRTGYLESRRWTW
jgi:hypothetical protein